MKLQTILAIMTLAGCAQLMQGATQPVITKGGGVMYTTCSGAVEDWLSCASKARSSCPNGYEVIDRNESPVGGRRELTFKCN